MTTIAVATRRFTSDMLAGLDEPIRRYFTHAISEGARLLNGASHGDEGAHQGWAWLPFTAEPTVDRRSFVWGACSGTSPCFTLTYTVILARFDLPPERPEVRLRIHEHGAIRTVSAERWGNAGEDTFQYIPSEAKEC